MVRNYKYLIVGGGMTAASAVEGIRSVDPQGSIGLVSAEPVPPYNRPPLSKGLWKGKPLERIWRKTDQPGVDYHLNRRIVALDPAQKRAADHQGQEYAYEKLLLATGGEPRRLPFGDDSFIYFRTLDDYHRLRELAAEGGRFAVIGGGFIGAEIAAALRMNGQEVAMIFPENGIGARVFPEDLSLFLNGYYREKGVEVYAGELVSSVERSSGELVLRTNSGLAIQASAVVAGIGIRPNTELAESAGLDVGDGILVDEFMRTSQADIYAAGDAASFYNPALGRRLRVEHEDNANSMGRAAGENMAGRQNPYHHLPFFYSDLFDLGYEAVGDLNPAYEVVADWQEPCQKGVLYYLKERRVQGVLLWNVWDQVDAARKLIAEGAAVEASHLKQRLEV